MCQVIELYNSNISKNPFSFNPNHLYLVIVLQRIKKPQIFIPTQSNLTALSMDDETYRLN
jgi:hypothetical protein